MFDATALSAVTDELNEKILRGRVQDVMQLDALTFGFEIYAQHARHYLYLTAHPEDARVHLVAGKLRGSGTASTPLLALLRKYARNAFVRAITQLSHERVLKIQFDHASEGLTTLVVETIGRYSNLILLDADDVVLDALKRVGAEINRARVTLPRCAYAPPPPQAKLDPDTLDAAKLARLLAAHAGAPLYRILVQTIAGVSPLLAREVTSRVGEPPDAPRLIETLARLTRAPWQPSLASEGDEPAAFAPYPLTHLPDRQTFPSISAAIEAFYGAPESYAAVKEPLRAQLAEARERLARKRDALADALPRAPEVERLRVSGEMILAHAPAIARGQERLNAETESGGLEIPLNPNLSVVDNAQRFFKEYRRQKEALARVPALLAEADAEVAYAEQMLNDLDLAENRGEIDAVIAAAREAGLVSKTRRRGASKNPSGPSAPREFTSREGFQILVGKHARQNEEVTFRRAKADDLWLHARNVAGAHVVILRAGREIPDATIQEAARLAAYYSAARGDTRVDVLVAPRCNVRRMRGGRAGMVTVRGGETRTVTPAESA